MASSFQNILSRLTDSALVGWRAAVSNYRQEYFTIERKYGWDSYPARMARYYLNEKFVDNSIYSEVNRMLSTYKETEKLYKYIRGLRNPVSRLVNIEKSKVFGGFVNFETFKDGAIVIKGADDILLETIRQIFQWTDIVPFKSLLVYKGASLGDVAIKVIDDLKREMVYMEVLSPDKVADVVFDSRGNVKEIYICYERYDYTTKRWYEYGEIITKEWFKTFKNGEPFAYMADENGNGLAEWPNPYGFVPVEWIRHVDVGHGFGATSFHNSRTKIDNLNDAATLLHNNIRNTVNTKYFVSGDVTLPVDANGNPVPISASTDSRDSSPLLKGPAGSEMKPIVFPIDILGALKAIDEQMREIEADLPQLALKSIRDNLSGSVSGIGIENLYSDSADVIQELQGNYINGLISAVKMAISIASLRRYDGFRAYNLESFKSGALDFTITPKPIFQNTIPLDRNIELTLQAADSSAAKMTLLKLGYTEDEIEEFLAEKSTAQRRQQRTELGNTGRDLRQAAALARLQAQQNGSPTNGNTEAVQAVDTNPPSL